MVRKKTNNRRWVASVKTVSTFPPEGTFTKDAHTVARIMASKKVSPKGIGSGIRMIQYFINRAGKGLSATRKKELEKAKQILQARLHRHAGKPASQNTRPKKRRPRMNEPVTRITPEDAQKHMERDHEALLVCAYDDKQKFQQYHLEGAIPLDEFRMRLGTIPKDREIIFYCA